MIKTVAVCAAVLAVSVSTASASFQNAQSTIDMYLEKTQQMHVQAQENLKVWSAHAKSAASAVSQQKVTTFNLMSSDANVTEVSGSGSDMSDTSGSDMSDNSGGSGYYYSDTYFSELMASLTEDCVVAFTTVSEGSSSSSSSEESCNMDLEGAELSAEFCSADSTCIAEFSTGLELLSAECTEADLGADGLGAFLGQIVFFMETVCMVDEADNFCIEVDMDTALDAVNLDVLFSDSSSSDSSAEVFTAADLDSVCTGCVPLIVESYVAFFGEIDLESNPEMGLMIVMVPAMLDLVCHTNLDDDYCVMEFMTNPLNTAEPSSLFELPMADYDEVCTYCTNFFAHGIDHMMALMMSFGGPQYYYSSDSMGSDSSSMMSDSSDSMSSNSSDSMVSSNSSSSEIEVEDEVEVMSASDSSDMMFLGFGAMLDMLCAPNGEDGYCVDNLQAVAAAVDPIELTTDIALCQGTALEVEPIVGCCQDWMLELVGGADSDTGKLVTACWAPVDVCAVEEFGVSGSITISNVVKADETLEDAVVADIAAALGVEVEQVVVNNIATTTATSVTVDFDIVDLGSEEEILIVIDTIEEGVALDTVNDLEDDYFDDAAVTAEAEAEAEVTTYYTDAAMTAAPTVAIAAAVATVAMLL